MSLEKKHVLIIAIVALILVVAASAYLIIPSSGLTLSFSVSPTSVSTGQSVSMSCAVSGGTSPYTFTITFGDGGQTSSGSTSSTSYGSSHAYSSGGSYSPVCSVSDSAGNSGSKVGSSVTVSSPTTTTTTTSSTSQYPQLLAAISANPTSGYAPLAVSFTAGYSGGNGANTYSWNFGDGSTASGSSTTHSFAAGSYTVTLTITDTVGQTAHSTQAITATQSTTTTTTSSTSTTSTATQAALQVSISASPTSGDVPLTVAFSPVVSGGSGSYSYSWAFGDGGTSTSSSVSHSYSGSGSYLAQLTVTDSQGHTASSSVVIQVNALTSTTGITSTSVITTSTTVTVVSSTVVGGSTITSTVASVSTFSKTMTFTNTNIALIWPAGLAQNWAVGNVSVGASQITTPIYLNGKLNVSDIQSSIAISHIAFNQSIVQLEFSKSGPVQVSMLVSELPQSVYADNQQISTWTYQNGVLTINADPSTLTVIFQSVSNGVTSPSNDSLLLMGLSAAIIISILVAAIYAVKKR